MEITVRNGNKKLISSGIINIEVDTDPSIEFDVYGLPLTLTIKILSHDDEKNSSVAFDSSEDSVSITHFLKQNSEKNVRNAGMLTPTDFAITAEGKDIFISWYVIIENTVDNTRIARVSYSFYEAV